MADGSRRFAKYQERWFTGVLAKKQSRALKLWPFVFLLSAGHGATKLALSEAERRRVVDDISATD